MTTTSSPNHLTRAHALTRSHAESLDRADPLASYRDQFVIQDDDLIYLDGNSLGRLPKRTADRIAEVVNHEWGARLIRGWGEGWFTLAQRLGGKIAGLIGAQPDEVLVADSTTVNFFKLVLAALGARPGRRAIVTDDLNFPSDLYVLQGAARLTGPDYRLLRVPSPDGLTGPEAEIVAALGPHTALLTLTHTAFKSGFVYDMPALTAAAHQAGALVLWDLSHSVGALPVDLNSCGVDLAVGCTYKYLNGGPGAPAFLYVRRDLQDTLLNPIWGWFGQQGQFDMGLDYAPAPGLGRFLVGTPSMLSLAAIEPAVDLLLEAGLDRLRAKSVAQTEYLIALWESELAPLGFTLNSPRNPARRGSHVSLGHPEALRIDRALIEELNVIPDFRYPDNLRLGLAPLYTRFVDVFDGLTRIRQAVTERRYEHYPLERPAVT